MSPELQDAAASRREALAAGGVVLAGLFSAAPAQAFLGFGEGEAREAAYKDETVSGREGGLKLHTGISAFIARALHTWTWQQCGRAGRHPEPASVLVPACRAPSWAR